MSHDDVWQRGSQPCLNDAPNVPTGANVDRTPATVNCSLVTAAALLTYGTGQHTSSGTVARMLNHGQDSEQGNANFGGGSSQTAEKQNRRQGLKIVGAFDGAQGGGGNVIAKTAPSWNKVSQIGGLNDAQVGGMQRLCQQSGMNVSTPNGDQTLASAMRWMKTQPDGTLFGVLLESEGHWNVAKVYDDIVGPRLSFADFQTDHAEMGGLRTGQLPQEAVANKIMDDNDSKVRVFAVTPLPPPQATSTLNPSITSTNTTNTDTNTD